MGVVETGVLRKRVLGTKLMLPCHMRPPRKEGFFQPQREGISPFLTRKSNRFLQRPLTSPAGYVLLFLWFAAGFGVVPGLAQECLDCHGGMELDPQRPGLTIAVQDFEQSVHAALECSGCHTDVGEFPHDAVILPQCSTCHPDASTDFAASVHGQALARGDRDVASCQNCHGSAHTAKRTTDPASQVYPLNLPRTCGVCHGDPELARRHGIPVANAYQLYMDSIHGRALTQSGLLVAANCSSCHGFHTTQPKADPASRVHRRNIPSTCGECHAGILPLYSESVHGVAAAAGNVLAPVCSDCHTAHEIARVDTVSWQLDLIRECGTCHEESLRTYRDTFHGQVTALGFTRVARCADCHGSHAIVPASNPNSSVSSSNRVATCRKCHPQANGNFAQFSPHADPADSVKNPDLYYAAWGMHLLMIGVFTFFGLHTSLWLVRSLIEQMKGGPPKQEAEEQIGEEEKKGWGA